MSPAVSVKCRVLIKAAAVSLGLLLAPSCGYFDPLNPLVRGDGEPVLPPVSWERVMGGNGTDAGSSIQPTADGGYIITGHTTSFGVGDSDLYLVYYKP